MKIIEIDVASATATNTRDSKGVITLHAFHTGGGLHEIESPYCRYAAAAANTRPAPEYTSRFSNMQGSGAKLMPVPNRPPRI